MSSQPSTQFETSAIQDERQVSESREPVLAVTGATGFLGSEILKVGSNSLRVVGLGRTASLADPSVQRVDFETISPSAFQGVDQVIHTIGLAHQFGRRADNRTAFEQTNVDLTRRTAVAAAEAGVRHFILISSVAVYGSGEVSRTELDPCLPQGNYGETKLAGEQAAINTLNDTATKLTILRLATLYGPGDRGNVHRLINGLRRGTFPSIGKGENQKTLLHVRDAAIACLKVAEAFSTSDINAQQPAVEVFNVAAPPVRMREIVQEICSSLQISPPRFKLKEKLARDVVNLADLVFRHRGAGAKLKGLVHKWLRDDLYDGQRFNSRFSFSPSISLADGIRSQIKAYRLQSQAKPALSFQRTFDIVLAALLLLIFAIPMLIVTVAVRLTSPGPAVYWSKRVGRGNRHFSMAKFRSMRIDTPQLATHLLGDSKRWITPIGQFLRKSSLDELPQLWNILVGNMSFVGPRPALFNQHDLIAWRTVRGVAGLRPGITGWAQINGRDELSIPEKVEFDRQYHRRRSLWFDLKIIALTALKVIRRDGIRQADQPCDESLFTVMQRGKNVLLLTTDTTLPATAQALETLSRHQSSGATLINVRDVKQIPEILSAHARGHRLCLMVVRKQTFADDFLARCETAVLAVKIVALDELQTDQSAAAAQRLRADSLIVGDWLQHLGGPENRANVKPLPENRRGAQ
ncbi:MAG: sugar transferase [Pirellulaceae bacterium]